MTDPYAAAVALGAPEPLAAWNRAGVLHAGDVHVATTLARLGGEADGNVLLATALTVRALRHGSVCVDLAGPAYEPLLEVGDAGPVPAPAAVLAACRASGLVASDPDDPGLGRPLRLTGTLLALERAWREECVVRDAVAARGSQVLGTVAGDRLRAALDAAFGGRERPGPDQQRLAVAAALLGGITIVAGGPGTGKTYTVARLVQVAHRVQSSGAGGGTGRPRVALAAPTGKAAARLREAVAAHLGDQSVSEVPAPEAVTLHRLLGARGDGRFRHGPGNRLPYDLVVVDEASMVGLSLMARLLQALRPTARLVLVGDPDQLASVEAGAVLGDLVHREPPRTEPARTALLRALLPDDFGDAAEGLANDTVTLLADHRFDALGEIATLAAAIRAGDPDRTVAVLRGGSAVRLVHDPAAVQRDGVSAAAAVVRAAIGGDQRAALAGLSEHAVLCGHRRGPYGVAHWNRLLAAGVAAQVPGYDPGQEWPPGLPVLVTANDPDTGTFNGDLGVALTSPTGPVVAFPLGGAATLVRATRLGAVQHAYALTVHRAQGSQFRRVTVVLPEPGSRLLTRELLYTAVTRAREQVVVLGTEDAVRRAVERPVARSSGLRRRDPWIRSAMGTATGGAHEEREDHG